MGPKPRSNKTVLGLIFSIMLMDVLGNTLLYPVSAYIVRQYSQQALMVTLLSVIYSAGQFFAAPLLGKLSDRAGRRPVLLLSLCGSVIGYLVFGLAGALWILFISRLVDGITGGNMSTASAYIADISKPEELSRNFSLIGLAWGLGLIIGPALGGFFGQISLREPAFLAALLSLTNMLLGIFWLPESLPVERRETTPIRPDDFNPFKSIGTTARIPGLGVLLLILCLFIFATQGMSSTETLFLIHRFSVQPWQIGALLVLAGAVTALVQATVQWLVKAMGEKAVALASLPLLALGALATSVSPVFWLVFPFVFLRSAASGFIYPTLSAISTRKVAPQEIGVLMGVTTALTSLMTIASPITAGVLYDHWTAGAPYWLTTALLVVAALILSSVPNSRDLKPEVRSCERTS